MSLDKNAHRDIMLEVLEALFKNKDVGPNIGFKGGTAVYFVYALNRFSVDLDFDILDVSKTDEIFEKVGEILKNFGEVKNADNKSKGLFFSLSYDGKKVGGENLKFDFSKKSVGAPSNYEVKEYFGFSMNVMVQEDMVANKMAAMHDRGDIVNRDIFDVWFFLKKKWPINKELLKERTGLEYIDFLKESIKMLEKDKNRNFLSGLGELMEDEKQKVWVKTKMREELIFLLKLALQNEEE